jgi:hypothetical protein
VTVGHNQCLKSILELCLFLILPTSKPEYIRISHTFLLNTVICKSLLSAYPVLCWLRVVAHRPLDSRGACEVWELGEEVVRRCAAPNDFTLGNRVDAVWAGADREVIPSKILLLRQSTKRLKLAIRSTPMIGIWTSATTKRQVKSRRSPRMSVRMCHPQVGMGVPLGAKRS